jgi:hypothetical protein
MERNIYCGKEQPGTEGMETSSPRKPCSYGEIFSFWPDVEGIEMRSLDFVWMSAGAV